MEWFPSREMLMTRLQIAALTTLAAVFTTGCKSDQTVSPDGRGVRAAASGDCAVTCLLVNSDAPLRAAWANPDSANQSVSVAQVVVKARGVPAAQKVAAE